MAFDPQIILGVGRGVQQIDTPLEMEAKRLVLANVRQKAQDEQQARADDAAFRQALQATGGDWDSAIQQLRTQGRNTLPIEEALTKHRNNVADGIKKQLDAEKTKFDVLGRIIPNVRSQEDWDQWLPVAAQIDPEFVQHVGPRFNAQVFTSLQNMGVDPDKQFEAEQKAIEALGKGDYLKAAATFRATSNSPEDWDGSKQILGHYKVPPQIISHVEQMTPEQIDQVVHGVQKPEKTPNVGTFEDYVVRTYGPNPTPAQILAARKAYGQADDRAVRVSVNAGGTAAGGLSTGEGGGLELAGTWARLGQRVPIGLTRGANPVAIANEAARQNKLLGRTPVQAMLKSAMLKSDQKALDQITKSAAGAEAYESKALAQLDIVDGLSDKVWRTKSPMVNAAINAGQTQILGDDDAQLLLNAILTASTEYAKIMSGGTGSAAASSDSAQAEAKKLLHMGMGQGTLKKATALMRQEMALTMNGYDVAKQHINENMNSAAGGQTPAVADPLTVVAPNGKTYKFTTPEKAAAFKKAAGIQ